MMYEQTVGILLLTVPPILIGYFLFRRNLAVFRLLVALVLVGTGYLIMTGAARDIGRSVLTVSKTAPAR
jgi:hypothetical protein